MQLKKISATRKLAATLLLCSCILLPALVHARMGGAGGHSSSGGSGSGSGSGMALLIYFIIEHPFISLVVIGALVFYNYWRKKTAPISTSTPSTTPGVSFPVGLDKNKIVTAFLAIQDAWQRKDLTKVRKWLSDGMYQRASIQFKMMDALGQKNILSNIQITNIEVVNAIVDGPYLVVDVAISFKMNDSFTSSKYPQFNENYPADIDTEYWTFIKRTSATSEKNLYDNNNCPNCGAPFEVKMGEISRCANCNTLTNSAAYDWVLSEIIQNNDYSRRTPMPDGSELKVALRDDPFFALQRIEDITSNIFMQVMDAMTTGDVKRLSRFASHELVGDAIANKQKIKPFVYDRLYINNVTLSNYTIEDELIKLFVMVKVTYRRVSIGQKLEIIDSNFVTRNCKMELTRSKNVTGKAGEVVYSYECSSCGAPYTDTTQDNCEYCDAQVVDTQMNWVLMSFAWA